MSITPDCPLRRALYRCGKAFHTEGFPALASGGKPAYLAHAKVGVLVLGGERFVLYRVQGEDLRVAAKYATALPNRQGRGGYSQNRFARLREESIDVYIGKAAEACARALTDGATGAPDVVALVVCGSRDKIGPLVKKLDRRFSKLVKVRDETDLGSDTAVIAVAKAAGEQADTERDANACGEALDMLSRDPDALVYGERDVADAMSAGRLASVIHVAAEPDDRMEAVCLRMGCAYRFIAERSQQASLVKERYGGLLGTPRY